MHEQKQNICMRHSLGTFSPCCWLRKVTIAFNNIAYGTFIRLLMSVKNNNTILKQYMRTVWNLLHFCCTNRGNK